LGAPEKELLAEAPDLLAEVVASHATNITVSQAKMIVAAATRIVAGQATLDEEVSNLTSNSLRKAFANITEKLRGTLIEKDYKGFLVSLEPRGNNTDERVAIAKEAKREFSEGLSKLGYKVEVLLGGDEYMGYELHNYAEEDIKKSDRLSTAFVVIILALIMESIAAVFLPFIGIGFGLVTSLASAFLLAKAGIIDVTTHSRTIMFTTGLGLGIDYAAYVSRRFREAASKELPSREAAVEAYKASLRPVIAGATAAMIGFGSMLLAWDFPFVSSIGADVPLTIFFVMVASLTFIPALLAYVGESRWFWWPRHPVETGRKTPRFMGAGRWSVRHPGILLGIAVILALIAGGVMYNFQGSYNIALNLPPGSEARHAIDYINTHYDAGVLYPVTIVASSHDKAVDIAEKVTSLECVSKASIEEGYQGRVISVVMGVDPLSKEGVDCASKIRSLAHSIDPGSLVGGMSAVNLDLHDLINDRFYHRVYPVAITLMFIVFLAVYGGFITAISAMLAVVIAAYAGSALTVLLYEKVLGTSVLWYLPVIVFTAILGVGMDYNSFYIARAREECMRECSKEAVARSIALATPTVLGLATIMAGAYVGLALASSPGLSMMGTALVFGVILAGFNASLLLTPPLVAILMRASWWPSKTGSPEAAKP
jgi:RND superfamily putative drug exporter